MPKTIWERLVDRPDMAGVTICWLAAERGSRRLEVCELCVGYGGAFGEQG